MSEEQRDIEEIQIPPADIENVDVAIYNWLDDEMNIFSTTNKGWKKVPTLWVSAERAFQTKRDKGLRDKDGALILPIITIERTGITKDPGKKGIYWGNIPSAKDARGGSIEITKIINQDKTSNFASATSKRKTGQLNFAMKEPNKKVVYQTASIPMPVYIEMDYAINIRTEYQQQMNEITQAFMSRPGGINRIEIDNNGYRYEGFVQPDFSQESNVADMGEEERRYQTIVTVKVLGYVIGEGNNENRPAIIVRENAVEVKFPKESVMVGDETPWKKIKGC